MISRMIVGMDRRWWWRMFKRWCSLFVDALSHCLHG